MLGLQSEGKSGVMELPARILYRCIVVDPPWPHEKLPYPSMEFQEIASLGVETLVTDDCHLWLWTTNRCLRVAFDILDCWGFHYLTTITWVKPSGMGAWFANTTQHCLFAYRRKCVFEQARWLPTHFNALPGEHSRKPDEFYKLVRQISPEPRLDLFNRREIAGFEAWGDEASK